MPDTDDALSGHARDFGRDAALEIDREFKSEFPAFCRLLGISPLHLARGHPQQIPMVMLARAYALLVSKCAELDARLTEVERHAVTTDTRIN